MVLNSLKELPDMWISRLMIECKAYMLFRYSVPSW